MNYSTLQEAYNIDTFEKKSKPSQKPNKNNGSMMVSSNTSPAFANPSYTETSKLALNSNKLSDYPNNNGSSCAPLQAPNYNIPISNQCKKEHDDAMNVYTNANNNNTNMMNSITNNTNNPNNGIQSSANMTNVSHAAFTSPQASAASATSTAPASNLNYSANMFNNLKSSNDNVMPYYDEDLEQYFNISNLNDEVKYNSNNSYMPNYNKQSYTNNDTAEYTNNTAIPKNGNNLLNNSSYNLTPEEKKSAEDAIAFLKSIEEKINNNGNNINSSGYNKSSIPDPVIPTINTGPGGFKPPNPPEKTETEKTETDKADKTEKAEKADKADKPDKPDNNYIYNAIFNIAILLIIGIAIILLCDQMVELAIHIGMKRVVYILEPYLKNQIHAQELLQ